MIRKTLFVDDELELWEDIFAHELGPFGFKVIGESDPAAVIKAIAKVRPDIVLLDIHFPSGFIGKQLLEKIKQIYPRLPVIMITGIMTGNEYKSEEYILADYRYAKSALAEGDFRDLAGQMDRILRISKIRNKTGQPLDDKVGFIVGRTDRMRENTELALKAADQDQNVLITGESGTGKELMAGAVHFTGKRKKAKFIPVVCAAIPKDLVESELFGHEKGAFTGAITQKKGRFETAENGTIFLDEIGELALDTQVKLLRFLQEKQFERLGSNRSILSRARIIAATNQDLEELVAQGLFREDLFYRLNVIHIHLPPLRSRKQDIPIFFTHFIEKANHTSDKRMLPELRDDVRQLLLDYHWPGNIREFENAVNRGVSMSEENILQPGAFEWLKKKGQEKLMEPSGTHGLSRVTALVYDHCFGWEDIRNQYGSGGIQKDIINAIIDEWLERHDRKRPSAKDLAGLLGTSPGNIRRILFKHKIKLTEIVQGK